MGGLRSDASECVHPLSNSGTALPGFSAGVKKTVESRFSADRRTPYEKVMVGDVILLKKVGGPICGIARANNVWCYQITPHRFSSIRLNFGERLQIEDPELWARYKKAAYATLIQLDNVRQISPLLFAKRDQRAWITFKQEPDQIMLSLR